jgi:hypothetical protein
VAKDWVPFPAEEELHERYYFADSNSAQGLINVTMEKPTDCLICVLVAAGGVCTTATCMHADPSG